MTLRLLFIHFRSITSGLLVTGVITVMGASQTAAEGVKADSLNWCGTQKKFEQNLLERGMSPAAAAGCPSYGDCDVPETRDGWTVSDSTPMLYVRLAIHTLANSDGSSPFTTEAAAQNAVNMVNQLYLPSRIQFDFSFDQVNSSDWRLLGEDEVDAMKNASAKDPAHWLNVWVGNVEFAYSFGTFPFSSDALGPTGGIVLGHFHWGGTFSSFAHEIGHCLGLWHTFHGVSEVTACGSCYESVGAPDRDLLGDLCSDTPPTPTWYSCSNASGLDTCSDQPWGGTQPENLMAYTPGSCRTMFTTQQQARMHCWFDDVLSGWLSGVTVEGDTVFGQAPLPVELSAQTYRTVESWHWDLGDETTGSTRTVSHTYAAPGLYSVGVEINTAENSYSDFRPDLVWVHSDTVSVSRAAANPLRPIRVHVEFHNFVPMSEMLLPVTWSAENSLSFDSISTVGLRGAGFDSQEILYVDNTLRQAAIHLIPSVGGESPLNPGSGTVLALFFTPMAEVTDTTTVSIGVAGTYEPYFACPVAVYAPTLIDGAVFPGACCSGRVGDANGDGNDEPSISDVSSVIDMMFISGNQVRCLAEADVNQSGGTDPDADDITIGDISILIDYLFIAGPGRGLPACM